MADKNKALEQIYETIKKLYGDCLAVEIFVNCEGIRVATTEMPFTIGCSMRTLNGNWLKRKEDDNG